LHQLAGEHDVIEDVLIRSATQSLAWGHAKAVNGGGEEPRRRDISKENDKRKVNDDKSYIRQQLSILDEMMPS
jgi:hypothetical protein